MDHHAVNDEALDTIFRTARTQNKWLDKPVSPALLMAVYDLMRFGPTSANCSPARLSFPVDAGSEGTSEAGSASPGNAPKIRDAPAIAIIGYDLDFRTATAASVPAQSRTRRTGSPIRSSNRSRRFATARCRAAISSSRPARSASIAVRCRASTTPGVDEEFFAGTQRSSRTSSAASAMAIRPACSRAVRG